MRMMMMRRMLMMRGDDEDDEHVDDEAEHVAICPSYYQAYAFCVRHGRHIRQEQKIREGRACFRPSMSKTFSGELSAWHS